MHEVLGLSAAWEAMPGGLRSRLAVGSVGKAHLLEAAERGAAEAAGLPPDRRDRVLAWCRDIFLAALADDPLDGATAAAFLAGDRAGPWLPAPARTLCRTLAENWRPPDSAAYYQRLAARRDGPRLRAFLDDRLAEGPSLFWLRQAMALAVFEADPARMRDLAARPLPPDLAPVRDRMRAEALALSGDPGAARPLFEGLAPVFGAGYALGRAACARLASGQGSGRDLALGDFRQALAAAPWQANALLRAFDLASGRDREAAPLPGSLAVLLYSFNKCADLDATLAALARADLDPAGPSPANAAREAGPACPPALIVVLDNGSTDGTAAMLARWQERLGPDRLRLVGLPVNVGAPAARNWLMALPAVRERDFLLFLDDDTDPPPDLAARLGAAVRRYPGAGVWGCKVADADEPSRLQSADLHLTIPREFQDRDLPEIDLSAAEPNPFRLSDLHIQEPDQGRFDYLRPCLSVTGCCHLLRTRDLEAVGGFSLFLSPTQYDDVERDLRSALAGRPAVYQGHLRVGHRKSTGAAARTSPEAQACALANKYKMQAMHPRSRILALLDWERRVLLEDLEEKARFLDAANPGRP